MQQGFRPASTEVRFLDVGQASANSKSLMIITYSTYHLLRQGLWIQSLLQTMLQTNSISPFQFHLISWA